MKFLFFTTMCLVLNFNAHCQTNYFNPNLYCRYLLDSLNIPYLPMKLRITGEGFSESYRQKFVNFFEKDLSYIPSKDCIDRPYDLFTFDKKFGSERDDFFNFFMESFECKVSALSIIPINHEIHKSIWLLELYSTLNDSFSVVLYFEDKNGIFHTIYENASAIPESWEIPGSHYE